MNNKKSKPLGGGVHQLNNNQLFNLQLFADTLNYNKVDNPYNFYLNKPTWTKGDIKEVYDLYKYYKKIPNYNTITTLPEENADYIKEALPNVTDCRYMLYDCNTLVSIDTTGWNTSNVTNMHSMFSWCNALTNLDVSKWNTSNVTNMGDMFGNCNKLQTLDVSKWNTSNVTNMDNMFGNCYKLTTLDASNWDTSNVTSMNNMFFGCRELTTLDASNWDTSKVTGMNGMFENCYKLTSLNVSKLNTSKVTNMDYMFEYCKSLRTITGVIDMKSCTSYDSMFYGCPKLTGVKIKNPPSGITATSGIGGLRVGKYEIVS